MPGPRRTPTPPALSPARARVLRAVASADSPATLATISDALGGHPNTTRQQLDALAADGLVDVSLVTREGRGRRPQAFALTDLGRHALGTVTLERSDVLDAFAHHLGRFDHAAAEAREVGRIWAERRADIVTGQVTTQGRSDTVAAVVEVLDALGFEPSLTSPGDAVTLRACPLLDLAQLHPQVICGLHQGLIDGLVRRLGGGETAVLTPFSEPDGCLVRVGSATP